MPEHGGGKLPHIRRNIRWSDEVDAIVPGDLAIARLGPRHLRIKRVSHIAQGLDAAQTDEAVIQLA